MELLWVAVLVLAFFLSMAESKWLSICLTVSSACTIFAMFHDGHWLLQLAVFSLVLVVLIEIRRLVLSYRQRQKATEKTVATTVEKTVATTAEKIQRKPTADLVYIKTTEHGASDSVRDVDYLITPPAWLKKIIIEPWGMPVDVGETDEAIIRLRDQQPGVPPIFEEEPEHGFLIFDGFSCPGTTVTVFVNGEEACDFSVPVPGGGDVIRKLIQGQE